AELEILPAHGTHLALAFALLATAAVPILAVLVAGESGRPNDRRAQHRDRTKTENVFTDHRVSPSCLLACFRKNALPPKNKTRVSLCNRDARRQYALARPLSQGFLIFPGKNRKRRREAILKLHGPSLPSPCVCHGGRDPLKTKTVKADAL